MSRLPILTQIYEIIGRRSHIDSETTRESKLFNISNITGTTTSMKGEETGQNTFILNALKIDAITISDEGNSTDKG